MSTYDVFISCKSEDYQFAEEIYDFLKSKGIYAFLASKELRRLGESEYRKSISKALKDAYHMIIFASQAEYIESTWVEYEWDMFINAKLKGKKSGNIVTILKDVDTDDIPMDLWKYESFEFNNYKDNIIKYVETEASIKRYEEIKRKEEEANRLKHEAEAEQAKKRELKKNLIEAAEEYKKDSVALQVNINKINSILHALEVDDRICPICKSTNPIEEVICPTCGWQISPLDGFSELDYLNSDSNNIRTKFLEIYNENQKSKEIHQSFLAINNDYNELKIKYNNKITEIDNLKKTFSNDFQNKEQLIKELENQIIIQKETIKTISNQIKELQKTKVINESQPTIKNNPSKNGFEVWVKFCPSEVEKLLESYNKTINFQKLLELKKTKSPIFVSSYAHISEAQALKSELEHKGATVEIRRGEKVVVPSYKPVIYPTKGSHDKTQSSMGCYRIIITNCGQDVAKVARVLSRYFKQPTTAFKNSLMTLPYETRQGLPKKQAMELLAVLKQLGVSAEFI